MNSQEEAAQKKRKYSKVSRGLLIQYFLALISYVIGLILLALLAWQFCLNFTWYDDNPLYWILKFVKDYILVFIGIPILLGWVFITYRFISKPLRYLDEVVAASEQLAAPTMKPIVLSDILSNTASELNHVREMALYNIKAAQEAEQRKNDLIVYLAHDLKTPLTSVIGYLTLLRDEGQISEKLKEKYLSISLEKAERLEDLINEFFEITRFNLLGIELQYSSVNLTRMLEQLTYEFKPMLLDKNLQCSLNIAPDVTIKCDVNKMQRVFDNLLRNAVFYSFENSTVEVSVIQCHTEISIKFVNHGNTIPKEKLGRIFEQFYRLDTSRSSNNGGAGLGLAIAKEIIDLHHGTITAASENETIEFCVTLPLS
ncbi:MAG: vancomycin resistance histidine kinase VanS [Lachnospiraceae bacterium]